MGIIPELEAAAYLSCRGKLLLIGNQKFWLVYM